MRFQRTGRIRLGVAASLLLASAFIPTMACCERASPRLSSMAVNDLQEFAMLEAFSRPTAIRVVFTSDIDFIIAARIDTSLDVDDIVGSSWLVAKHETRRVEATRRLGPFPEYVQATAGWWDPLPVSRTDRLFYAESSSSTRITRIALLRKQSDGCSVYLVLAGACNALPKSLAVELRRKEVRSPLPCPDPYFVAEWP
jgi:hypothetical protein